MSLIIFLIDRPPRVWSFSPRTTALGWSLLDSSSTAPSGLVIFNTFGRLGHGRYPGCLGWAQGHLFDRSPVAPLVVWGGLKTIFSTALRSLPWLFGVGSRPPFRPLCLTAHSGLVVLFLFVKREGRGEGAPPEVATASTGCLSGIHCNQSQLQPGSLWTPPPPSFQQPSLFSWDNQEQPTVALTWTCIPTKLRATRAARSTHALFSLTLFYIIHVARSLHHSSTRIGRMEE